VSLKIKNLTLVVTTRAYQFIPISAHSKLMQLFSASNSFFTDPDPASKMNTDPDPDPAFKKNTDPDPRFFFTRIKEENFFTHL